jgi:hypothetical protein
VGRPGLSDFIVTHHFENIVNGWNQGDNAKLKQFREHQNSCVFNFKSVWFSVLNELKPKMHSS